MSEVNFQFSPMYGSCLYHALYKFKTLLRASARSMDKMGFTCLTVALTDWEAIFFSKRQSEYNEDSF